MGLEHQLQFDISRCELCRLTGNKAYCSPAFYQGTRFFLVLESPDGRACTENNAWSSQAASTLSRALGYAHGGLSDLHLTYLIKCSLKEQGRDGRGGMPLVAKRVCARNCATTYLHQELEYLQPHKVLLFGELSARLFRPDDDIPWEKLVGTSFPMPHYNTEGHIFESPGTIITRGGLRSAQGCEFIKRLNSVLGGRLALPDTSEEESISLFECL